MERKVIATSVPTPAAACVLGGLPFIGGWTSSR